MRSIYFLPWRGNKREHHIFIRWCFLPLTGYNYSSYIQNSAGKRKIYRILSVTEHSTLYCILESRDNMQTYILYSIQKSTSICALNNSHKNGNSLRYNWEDLIRSGLQTLLSEMFEIFLIWVHFISFPSVPHISRFPDFSMSLHYKPHYNFGQIILQT